MHACGHDGHTATLLALGKHLPQVCTDVVVAGAQMVTTLQTLVSREMDPQEAVVLSVTRLQAGTGACNVLPASALLTGTVRTLKP